MNAINIHPFGMDLTGCSAGAQLNFESDYFKGIMKDNPANPKRLNAALLCRMKLLILEY